MAKGKDPRSVQNRHVYSRISYLYQAAALFATRGPSKPPQQEKQQQKHAHPEIASTSPSSPSSSSPPPEGVVMSRRLLTDLRNVSLKTQIRLNPRIKRTICRFCDTLLVEGSTCASAVENPSRGGRKPWADVLVCRCLTCGGARRYPVGAERQKRRPVRGEGESEAKGTRMEGGKGVEERDEDMPMAGADGGEVGT